jgi:hypothetical protein
MARWHGELHDRDRRGVRRQDGVGVVDRLVQPLEGLDLERVELGNGIHHKLPIGQDLWVPGHGDLLERGSDLLPGLLPPADGVAERGGRPVEVDVHGPFVGFQDRDLEPGPGGHLGDAGPHRPEAECTDLSDLGGNPRRYVRRPNRKLAMSVAGGNASVTPAAK